MINATAGNTSTNIACICGAVMNELKLNHKTYGEAFYTFQIGVLRSSGYEDQLTVIASERILGTVNFQTGNRIRIHGQVRTYNEDIDGRNHLHIVVFAREIEEAEEDAKPENDIYLEGYLCKKPLARTSPLGRKICDIMLAVNRMYNKSDYIPCIAWGRNAVYSGTLDVGEKISLRGRLQSRQYRKKSENGDVTVKTAYEVSILQMENLADPRWDQ